MMISNVKGQFTGISGVLTLDESDVSEFPGGGRRLMLARSIRAIPIAMRTSRARISSM